MYIQDWHLADYYEQYHLISSDPFQIFHDFDSQSEQIGHQTIMSDVHSPEDHKHITSVSNPQQPNSQVSNGTEFLLPQQTDSTNHSMKQLFQQEEQSQTSNKQKKAKRQDDNNNAHKPFITEINKTLKKHKLLDIIKKDLKKEGNKFEKGSRYSFLMRLIDARMILVKKNQLDSLISILNEYIESIKRQFELPTNPSPADHLKNQLIEPYIEATNLFLQGKQIEATQRIYDIKGAKQNKYKEEGKSKVKAYLAKRQLQ